MLIQTSLWSISFAAPTLESPFYFIGSPSVPLPLVVWQATVGHRFITESITPSLRWWTISSHTTTATSPHDWHSSPLWVLDIKLLQMVSSQGRSISLSDHSQPILMTMLFFHSSKVHRLVSSQPSIGLPASLVVRSVLFKLCTTPINHIGVRVLLVKIPPFVVVVSVGAFIVHLLLDVLIVRI